MARAYLGSKRMRSVSGRNKYSYSHSRNSRFITDKAPLVNTSRLQPLYRSLALNGNPQSRVVNLRWAERASITPAASGATTWWTGINACAAGLPQAGTTHQPRGHNELSAIYKKYVVLGARCTVIFCPTLNLTAALPESIVMLKLSDDVATGNVDSNVELGALQYAPVSHSNVSHRIMRSKYNASKWWAIKDARNEATLCSDFGAAPASNVYFTIGVATASGTSNLNPVDILVVVDYIIHCYDKLPMAGS